MATHLYDPGFGEPAVSIREVRNLLEEIGSTGDFRVLLKAQKYLAYMIDDGHDPETAWRLSALEKRFGPCARDGDGRPIGRLFKGVPGRMFR